MQKHSKSTKLDWWVSKKYTVFQESDTKIQITITTACLIRIKYPLSSIFKTAVAQKLCGEFCWNLQRLYRKDEN